MAHGTRKRLRGCFGGFGLNTNESFLIHPLWMGKLSSSVVVVIPMLVDSAGSQKKGRETDAN